MRLSARRVSRPLWQGYESDDYDFYELSLERRVPLPVLSGTTRVTPTWPPTPTPTPTPTHLIECAAPTPSSLAGVAVGVCATLLGRYLVRCPSAGPRKQDFGRVPAEAASGIGAARDGDVLL